jgi:antitoxin (DNA-binding transcriptional repressor) of toxin-antitoxin stability system
MKAGKPIARLVPAEKPRHVRQLGWALGEIVVPPDFDDPLPADLEASFYK